MIKCLCDTETKLLLSEMVPFQGDLKVRDKKTLEDMKKTLVSDGLVMPFAVWNDSGVFRILDGHGRREALIQMSLDDLDILGQKFPCIVITASDEETARKSLLQISSSYGRVNKAGLEAFTQKIPEYRAPLIRRLHKEVNVTRKNVTKKDDECVVLRIKIRKDMVDKVKEILSSSPYVTVL